MELNQRFAEFTVYDSTHPELPGLSVDARVTYQNGFDSTIKLNTVLVDNSEYHNYQWAAGNATLYVNFGTDEASLDDAIANHRGFSKSLGSSIVFNRSTWIDTGAYFDVTRNPATNVGTVFMDVRIEGYVNRWNDSTQAYDKVYFSDTYRVREQLAVETVTQFGSGAQITSAPNFTDEENPTISYVYDRGANVTDVTIEAAISLTGATDDIEYRPIPVVGEGSYTFELSGTERSKLWALLDEGTKGTVRFYLKTTETVGTETNAPVYNYVPKTVTFVNYTPVVTPSVVDINSDTLALTKDTTGKTMVRYVSTAYYETKAVARKGATIALQEVWNGEKTVYGETGMIENIPSNTFYFFIMDNRGYETEDAVIFNNLGDLKFVDYVKPTCNITTKTLTGDGDLIITISGKYYEGSFGTAEGAAVNKMTIDYDCHLQDEAENWVSLGVVEPQVDSENNYSFTFTLSDLEYTKAYQLTVKVSDELASSTSPMSVVVSQPIFDWSREDFRFYIPVQMDNGYTYPQTVLWSGVSQLGDGEVITLDHPISEQPTGIVLVFSLYRDGAAEDVSITTFFKSRAEIQYLMPYGKHTFLMAINSNLSVFGAKYITIEDDRLTGFEGNTNSGTASGSSIAFDNSQFVLRYVIGV